MKRKYCCLILFFLLFSFASYGEEKDTLRNVIEEYTKALNETNKEAIKSCFDNPNSISVNYILNFFDICKEYGVEIKYDILILNISIFDNIAEVKLKTICTLSGKDEESTKLLQMYSPPLINSIMTLRKNNGEWKIVSEEIIE